MPTAVCWAKSTRGSSFDFSQAVCCRGHVCVQSARNITLNSVVFFWQKTTSSVLPSGVKRQSHFMCSSLTVSVELRVHGQRINSRRCYSSVAAQLMLCQYVHAGFPPFFPRLGILKSDRSNFKSRSQWSFPEIKSEQNFQNGVECLKIKPVQLSCWACLNHPNAV